jgi:hypothetical protein
MDFQKSKIYLDKLQREFNRMSKDPENVVRLDIDILASYVRELYDAILSDPASSVPVTKPEPAPVRITAPAPKVEIIKETPPPPVVVEAPPPVVVEAPPPVVVEAPPPPVATPAPPPPPPVVDVKPPKPSPPLSGGLEALFEEKQAKELSEKLAESAISDLKKAIALNDRLLYTSELFAGDGKAFEAALNTLNEFAQFEEARDFLIHNYVVHYTWTDKKRVETAKAFIKLVRRRYK